MSSSTTPRARLCARMDAKRSCLCVGLDPDPTRIPRHLHKQPHPVQAFNQQIIDATQAYAVAYKLNTAFYEQNGQQGWRDFEATIAMIPKECMVIADAKRGDIGYSAQAYARAFFEHYQVDALTLSPYMGADSLVPFLSYQDKWSIVLGATSNIGFKDVQGITSDHEHKVYEQVIEYVCKLGTPEHLMFVAGATHLKRLQRVRNIAPKHLLLVPGVGAQGGSATEALKTAHTPSAPILVNVGRSILYADNGKNFQKAAQQAAQQIHQQMKTFF